MRKRVAVAMVVALAGVAVASAQSTSGQTPSAPSGAAASQSTPAKTSEPGDTRPATTTFMGDTGLWFVPTGEVLPRKKWSSSAYRVNFDDNQGFTDVSNWPLTFGYGVADHAEIFGSWVLVNRIDRDIRPLYIS